MLVLAFGNNLHFLIMTRFTQFFYFERCWKLLEISVKRILIFSFILSFLLVVSGAEAKSVKTPLSPFDVILVNSTIDTVVGCHGITDTIILTNPGATFPATNSSTFSTLSTTDSVVVTYNNTGTTALFDTIFSSANDTVVVEVYPQPDIAGRDTSICAGGTVDLGTLITGDTIGIVGYGTTYGTYTGSQMVTLSTAGTYTYYVRDSMGMVGCVDTAEIEVTVTPGISVTINGTTNGSSTICSGSLETLTASSTGTNVTYEWSHDRTESTVNVGIGSYTVTAMDANGCVATANFVVNVSSNTAPTVNNVTVCPGATGTLTVTGSGNYTNYVWSNGVQGATRNTITVPVGPYTVTVSESGGCEYILTGNIIPSPNPDLTGPYNICPTNGSVILNPFANGGFDASFTYAWRTPLGQFTTSTVTATTAGRYTVVVTDPSNNCVGTAVATVNVSSTPNAVVSPSAAILCSGNSTRLSTSTVSPTGSYIWSGPGIISGNGTPSIVVNQPGQYRVSVDVGSSCGSAIGTANIVPGDPIVGLTAASTSICEGQSLTLVGTGGAGNYELIMNGNTTTPYSSITTTNGSYSWVVPATALTAGTHTFYINLTNTLGCFGTTIGTPVVVTVSPFTPFVVPHPSNSVCAGTQVTYIASPAPTSATDSYVFYINGVPQPPQNSNVFGPVTAISGSVHVEVRNSTCRGFSTIVPMNVSPAPTGIQLIPTGIDTICSGSSKSYTVTGGNSGDLYDFYLNGNLVVTNNTNGIYISNNLTTADTIHAIVKTSNGCLVTTNQSITHVVEAPVISGPSSLCLGTTGQFTVGSGLSGGTWIASPAGGAVTIDPNTGVVTASSTVVGASTIYYQISTSNCTVNSNGVIVNVTTTGSVNIGSSADAQNNIICSGENLVLSVPSIPNSTYTWTASNSTTPFIGSNIFTVQPTASTTSTITYSVSVSGGTCTGTDNITVTVNPAPVAGAIVGGTAGLATICEDSTLVLAPSTSPSPSTTGVTITWNSSNPLVSVTNGIVTVSSSATTFPIAAAISYTITYNGCSDTSPSYDVNVEDCTGAPPTNTTLCVAAKAFLEGPFDQTSQLMHDSLRTRLTLGLSVDLTDTERETSPFPLTEPYTILPNFTHVGGGGETTTSAVMSVSGTKAVVDWVFLELRRTSDSTVVATKSALILRDGSIVDAANGTSDVCFAGLAGDYYLSVRHRNHLGIMTKSPISIASGTTAIVDMRSTNPLVSNYMAVSGVHPVDTMGTNVVMWGGDANSNGIVTFHPGKFLSDRDAVFFEIFKDPINRTSYNHIRKGYFNGDTNLDGDVKYQGPKNDLDRLMFFNVLSYPNTIGILQIIYERLP